ncbi:jg23566 [Pararge aegeria aegeria]|uniref:Jg23566 protein n=1 Tax=Pararge aegeria aegeria TaxID=348720 RepID=A0A8S4S017_9NEOP|nr:jg23566 [Pararge aegeria aegeria]
MKENIVLKPTHLRVFHNVFKGVWSPPIRTTLADYGLNPSHSGTRPHRVGNSTDLCHEKERLQLHATSMQLALASSLVVVELFVIELVRRSTTATLVCRHTAFLCSGLKGVGAGVTTGLTPKP